MPYTETLHGKKYVWFIIGWYPDNWYKVKDNRHICTVDQLKEALKGPFITEFTTLRLEPGLSEVGMVVRRVEEMEDRVREPNHKLQEKQENLLTWNSTTTNTLRIAGPPTPHRRSTQVAGTSEQVVLITQPTTKLPCQHPSTKVMHTSAHPGVLWEEPHQTQSINDDRRGPS
ncbi:hypothetical protein RRG08_054047 [Elysia crispata]|uniref:Uncharacterized protein n=1 Tax=Elysia crispata TaxID=231223 RepID=A0AAE1DDM4_9GAST|nr:hypothetical protein RRG08_054047 [Elysia crispata]